MKFVKNLLFLSLLCGPVMISFGVSRRAAARAARSIRRPASHPQTVSFGTKAVVGGTIGAGGVLAMTAEKPVPVSPEGQPGSTQALTQKPEEQEFSPQTPGEQAPISQAGVGFIGAQQLPDSERVLLRDISDGLAYAIKHHDIARIEQFLPITQIINAKDHFGNTPLDYAIANQYTDIAEMLINAGARVDLARIRSARKKDWRMKELLKTAYREQSMVNEQDKWGQTALMHAVTRNNRKEVAKLIEWGADIELADVNGNTPLLRALVLGHQAIVHDLISAGADQNKANKFGDTPNQILFNNLVEFAANNSIGVDMVKVSVEKMKAEGVDINKAAMGNTPLIIAVESGNGALVDILIAAGADVNQVDAQGATALMIASIMGSTEMVQLLLEAGAQLDYTVEGRTALDLARHFNRTEIVELLETEIAKRRKG